MLIPRIIVGMPEGTLGLRSRKIQFINGIKNISRKPMIGRGGDRNLHIKPKDLSLCRTFNDYYNGNRSESDLSTNVRYCWK